MRHGLEAEDVTAVALHTVREGSSHRRWPPEVVAAFARAEVIRGRAEPGRAARRVTMSEVLLAVFGHSRLHAPARRSNL